MGDINLCMSDWNMPDYSWKILADLWRSIIKENGLSYEFLGPTYFSNYIKEDGRTKNHVWIISILQTIQISKIQEN